MSNRKDPGWRLMAAVRGELLCGKCGVRPPRTPAHGRCWPCAAGGGKPAPPCRGCGGELWMSGWCRDCHPVLRPSQFEPRSCRQCFAWGVFDAPTCQACRKYAHAHPSGCCLGCDRDVPVADGYCRLCHHQARLLAGKERYGTSELANVRRTGHQLFLAATERRLWLYNAPNTYDAARRRGGSSPAPASPAGGDRSAWPVHAELFTLPADQVPPRITIEDEPRAAWHRHLALAAERLGEAKGWTRDVRRAVVDTLEALVAAHPAGTPVYQASALTRLTPHHRNIVRTLEILGELGMLEDDRADQDAAWLARRLQVLPEPFRVDVADWADVLRHGDRRNRPKSQRTWRHYLLQALPILQGWSSEHDSLRAITKRDVITALETPTPDDGDGHTRLTALRSLFGYLKASKRIFTNPACRLPRTVTSRPASAIPTRLSEAALSELAANDHSPAAWLIIVLAGHHALGAAQIQTLTLDDVSLTERHLDVGSDTRPLDPLTSQAIQRYLDHRNRRWPYTANPHLLVTQQSAHNGRPVSDTWIRYAVRGLAVSLDRLRQDRILDEAAALVVRDPLHLAAMFGLNPDTAQRYIDAIHGHASQGHRPMP